MNTLMYGKSEFPHSSRKRGSVKGSFEGHEEEQKSKCRHRRPPRLSLRQMVYSAVELSLCAYNDV
jgi:hypothetical protein